MTDQIPDIRNVVSFPKPINEPTGACTVRCDDGVPPGYHIDERGAWLLPEDDDVDGAPVHLSGPFRVTALCRRPDGSGWGKLIEFQDPDGRLHILILDAASLGGFPGRLFPKLVDRGLPVAPEAASRKALAKLIQRWTPRIVTEIVDAPGWTSGRMSFVLGGGRIVGQGTAVFAGPNFDPDAATIPKGGLPPSSGPS